MRGKSTKRMHLCSHRNIAAKDRNELRAIHQSSPKRPLPLVSHNHDVRIWIRQIMPEMMQDAPARAHAVGGNNDHGALSIVQLLRLIDRMRVNNTGET